jgi:hypothetical protein
MSKGHRNLKRLLFEEGDGLSKEVWVGREWKPKLRLRGRRFLFIKKKSLTRSWPLDWRGYFEQGIKWHAPMGLDFGLDLWRLHTMAVQVERPWEFMAKGLDFRCDLWRLHTMPGWRLHLLCFIGYFQLMSLDSQQSLATQSHNLSTWTAIVRSNPYPQLIALYIRTEPCFNFNGHLNGMKWCVQGSPRFWRQHVA